MREPKEIYFLRVDPYSAAWGMSGRESGPVMVVTPAGPWGLADGEWLAWP